MASPPDGEKVTEPCGADSPHAFFFGNGPLRSVFLLPLRGRTGSQCSRTRFGRFFTFNPNFKQMENIQTKQYPCFKRWSRKNWSVFASLHRYVTIGVLSVGMSILLLATQGASAQTVDTTAVLKTLRIREVGVTGSQTAPARNAQSHTPLFDRKAQAPAPVQTLEAALRLAPSVDVRERGGKGTQADIFIRGGSFDQTMVLLNGIDFTDARTGHQSHALPVDLDCISAVELIDGVPGVGDKLLSTNQDFSYLKIMNMMTGGSLANGTLFAMGIGPYINSSIIMQLLAVAIPPLERLSKQGEEGRRKISSYTRYLTILLAIIQSVGIIISYGSAEGTGAELSAILAGGAANTNGFTDALSYIVIVLFYTAGSCITMWIGERITEHGLSNGISLLIYAGIIASFATFVINEFSIVFLSGSGLAKDELWKFIGYIIIIIVVFAAIVWIELAERKIKVQYAKQVKGRKMYGGQSTEIPIKVNANGVMPLIFAFSILSSPRTSRNALRLEGIPQLLEYVSRRFVEIPVLFDYSLFAYSVLCVLLFADSVPAGRYIENHSAERRIYPRNKTRKAHRGLS